MNTITSRKPFAHTGRHWSDCSEWLIVDRRNHLQDTPKALQKGTILCWYCGLISWGLWYINLTLTLLHYNKLALYSINHYLTLRDGGKRNGMKSLPANYILDTPKALQKGTILCWYRGLISWGLYYRIALNFRGSKFSRIVIFEGFIKLILGIRCMHTLHAVCQKFSLKYFCKWLKIREICKIKDPRNYSINLTLTLLHYNKLGMEVKEMAWNHCQPIILSLWLHVTKETGL